MKPTYKELVTEFHLKNHQTINHNFVFSVKPEDRLLRMRLMMEESAEFAIALHEGDHLKMCDGLADFLYVVVGTMVTYGVEETPLGELRPLRKPGHLPPAVKNEILVTLSRSLQILFQAMATGAHLRGAFHTMMHSIQTSAELCSIPLDECFREVHRSNMTKNLGGATDGRKYGEGVDAKAGYSPADLQSILDNYSWV